MAIHKIYISEIYRNLRYRASWLPGTPMGLGTVGPIEDGIFRAVTDLPLLQIPFEETDDPEKKANIDFTSQTGVSMAFKAAGEVDGRFAAVAKAEAGALLEFSREGAVVLQLREVLLKRISDQARLSRSLMRAVAVSDGSKQWQRDWVVITEVARAGSATIIISNSKKSRLELKASGTTAPTSLVDISANLSVAAESDVSTKVIAESGLTPLYRALRIKRNFWWLYDEVLPASAEAPLADEVFGEADPAEDF